MTDLQELFKKEAITFTAALIFQIIHHAVYLCSVFKAQGELLGEGMGLLFMNAFIFIHL